MAWTPGQLLQNGSYSYRIERVLGIGGFGITYLADSQQDGMVVIKTLNDEVQNHPQFKVFQNDFLNEALRISRFHHPHIVKVHRLFQEWIRYTNPANGQTENLPLSCIVMEFIQGSDLGQMVIQQGALPEAQALAYIAQVGEALSMVHEQELLHRDIKPQNIMVRQQTNEAVLIDFGIAREFVLNMTRTHSQKLTPGYAPPEQYDERTKRGPFTDVYALAATLYHLVTGHSPPDAQTRKLSLLEYQQDVVVPPKVQMPELSDRHNKAIMKGMAVRSEYRPQTVNEWLQLLVTQPSPPLTSSTAFQPDLPDPPDSSPTPTPSPTPVEPVKRVYPNRRTILKWAGLAGFGSVGIAAATTLKQPTPPPVLEPDPADLDIPEPPDFESDVANASANVLDPDLVRVQTLDKPSIRVKDDRTIDLENRLVSARIFEEELKDKESGFIELLRLVWIPGGNFDMGSPDDEKPAQDNERPQHPVSVQGFWMGQFPVTQAEWQIVASYPKATQDILDSEPSRFGGNRRSVESISWDEAIEFCARLFQETGRRYRLPSEAEWEYACRANTKTVYSFGDAITSEVANYRNSKIGATTEVGRYYPNDFGLFDMHGNAWEWCADYWHDNYNNAPADGSAWVTNGETNLRVLRGGSWGSHPADCRAACRLNRLLDSRSSLFSFRVVVSALGS
ncbi:MAG: SUMF1/EgtB/PvdO family nonheme iron enzyme [Leptolyngbyaceae cyanobacterium]